MTNRACKFLVIVLVAAVAVPAAHAQAVDAAGRVYVVTFRTSAHVRTSSGEVFHNAAADTRRVLTECGVTIVADPERGFIESESRMSVASMTRLAREAGATSLLLVTVDRPFTEWIKITLQAYDLDGALLWEDKVGSGMGGFSGSDGYRKCFEKLETMVNARAGGPGLPVDRRGGRSGKGQR